MFPILTNQTWAKPALGFAFFLVRKLQFLFGFLWYMPASRGAVCRHHKKMANTPQKMKKITGVPPNLKTFRRKTGFSF